MENAFGKIVAILILIAMLFVVPVKYGIEKSIAMQEMYISTKTIELVDSARNTGFVTKDMYEQYLHAINRMNNIYEIKMEHIIYEKPDLDGNVEKHYISDLESKLYENGIYKFKIEEYFKIQVIERTHNRMISYYGGYIKNEAY